MPVESPLLPVGDEIDDGLLVYFPEDYSEEQIMRYVTQFFHRFLEEYKVLVETNFPTLKDQFETYKILPAYVIAELQFDEKEKKFTGIRWTTFRNDNNENEVEVRVREEESIFDWEKHIVKTRKGEKSIEGMTDMVLHLLLIPARSGNSGYIIQDWVYETVGEELKPFLQQHSIF